jgi:YYY domain-containing protein
MDDVRANRRVPASRTLFAPAAVLVLALAFRLFGLTWDDGYLLHPDERFLTTVVVDRIHWPGVAHLGLLTDPQHSPLNPRALGPDNRPQSFAYGALPLYVVDIASWTVERWVEPGALPHVRIAYVGRFLSAVADAVTIALAMLFAHRAYGRSVALLAGLLLALSVVMIQQAHFFVVDPWTTLFTMAVLVASLHLASTHSPRWALVAGAAFGCALATKASIVPLAVPVLLPLLQVARRSQDWRSVLPGAARLTALFAGASIVVFFLIEPYALLSPRSYLDDILLQWRIATGRFDVPYTLQYVGTIPVVYQLEQLLTWGLGPALGLSCLVGLGAGIRRWWRTRQTSDLILLSWVVAYGATILGSETKYLRYSLPVVPALVILASTMLLSFRGRARLGIQGLFSRLALATVVLGSIAWALAFSSIYWQPHTRVAASRWMLENIPPGTTIGIEHWDDALPLNLRDMPSTTSRFRAVSFALYDVRPNEEAFEYLASRLEQVEYIVLSSDRLSRSIPRLPWRYPVTSEYYRLLEQGQLGFRLVYEARVTPRLGPLRIDDLTTDESFTVYDHPRVRIYQKVDSLSWEELRERFAWALAQPFDPGRERPRAYLTLLGRPVSTVPAAHDIGWSTPLTGQGSIALAWWMVVVTALGASTLALLPRLFPNSPDGGFGFLRLLGLLAAGYVTWITVSLGLMRFTMPWLLLTLAATSVGSSLVARVRPGQLRRFLGKRAPFLVISEMTFWATFFLFLGFRWLNPDLWHPIFGGEKPMELAYLHAVARSTTFPPYDPWYADGAMNYYYYGFYLIAYLLKLSGVPPQIGFQLAVATLAAMLASGLLSLGVALGRAVRPRGRATARYLLASGATTTFLGLFSGNLDPLWQILSHGTLHIDFWQSSRAVTGAITEFPYFTFLWADLHPHAIAQPLIVLLLALLFSRWHASGPGRSPWTILMAGIASLVAGSLVVTNTWDTPLALLILTLFAFAPVLRRSPFRLRTVLLSAVLALSTVSASWFFFRPFHAHFDPLVGGLALTTTGTEAADYVTHFGVLIGLSAAAVVWWLSRHPFAYEQLRLRSVLFGVGASVTGYSFGQLVLARQLGLARDVDWPAIVLLLVMGGLSPFVVTALVNGKPGDLDLLSSIFLLNAGAGFLCTLRPAASVVLIPALLALIAVLRPRQHAGLGYLLLLAATGLWITIAVDLLVVVDDLYGSPWERMNTVFKFYLEAWLLLATASGVATTWLLWTAWEVIRAERRSPALGLVSRGALLVSPLGASLRSLASRSTPYLLVTSTALLLAAGALYPLLGTAPRLAQRMPTTPTPGSLDGYVWMRGGTIPNQFGEPITFTGDYAAIEWLGRYADGNAVVLEASIGPYRGNGARISSATGLPTVLGWDRHQRQQRESLGINQRLLDVREIYQTTDLERKRWLLRRYNVRYVIIGDVERRWRIDPPFAGATLPAEPYASDEGLAAFRQLEGTLLRRVSVAGSTEMYEVLPFPKLLPSTHGSDGDTGD